MKLFWDRKEHTIKRPKGQEPFKITDWYGSIRPGGTPIAFIKSPVHEYSTRFSLLVNLYGKSINKHFYSFEACETEVEMQVLTFLTNTGFTLPKQETTNEDPS